MKVWIARWDSAGMVVYASRANVIDELNKMGYDPFTDEDFQVTETSIYADDFIDAFETELIY